MDASSSIASTHPYSCLTCSLAFASSTAQRAHYGSDLHRYNAKRKVAELPPVTAEVFNDKIAERQQKLAAATGAGRGSGRSAKSAASTSTSTSANNDVNRKLECKACRKAFASKNAQEDHLKSKKHRENVMKAVSAIKVDRDLVTPSSNSEPAGEAAMAAATPSSSAEASTSLSSAGASAPMPSYTPTSCLFCPRSFSSLEVNLKHMSRNHAFYVPDAAYCVNVPGLLQQLGEDVALGNLCVFCGHGFGGAVNGEESDAELVRRAKRGAEAVKKHMVDKGHCRIPWDTEDQRLLYSDHYDYSSTYPDALNEHGEREVHSDEEGEWSDADEGEEIDEDDDVVMDYSAVRRTGGTRTKTLQDAERDARVMMGEQDYELVLPSGARIGHRALKGVYKQNVMPYIDLERPGDKLSRLTYNMQAREEKRQANSSALVTRGNSNMPMVVARNAGEAKNARKATYGHAANKAWQKQQLRDSLASNAQKHYRDPLLQ